MSRTVTALVWLLTRGFVLLLLMGPHAWVAGDVNYFAQSLSAIPDNGLASTLVEYPLPGIALVALPWLLAEWAGQPGLYVEIVVAFALVTDAAYCALLWHFARMPGSPARARRDALGAWLLAVPLLGATTYARFDLVPGVLVGVAVLLLVSHPRLAAAAGAVATGLKLWPALVLPALAAPALQRRAVVLVVSATGAALAVGSLVLAGWGRLVSPLTWQADRGLQIESVLASPAMVAWAVDSGGRHVVEYGAHNAFEIEGPGVPALLIATDLLTALSLLALVTLWVRAWRRDASVTVDAVAWLCLAAVAAFTVTSRVLSPQYLLWLLPATAACLAVVQSPREERRLRTWTAVLLVAAGVTQLVFPVLYGHLVSHDKWSTSVVALLVARNVMLVWLLAFALTRAWRSLPADPQRGRALEGQPPGPAGNETRALR